MSFINDALKRAQKERDTQSVQYQGVLAASVGKKPSHKAVYIWLLISLLICGTFIFKLYPLSDQAKDRAGEQYEDSAEKDVIPAVIEETPSEKDLIYEKALTLSKISDLNEAKKLYKKILDLDPGYVKALNNLGVIHIQDREYKAAQDNFKKAIRLKPSYVDPYYNLACLYSLTGELNQGFLYLKKAVSINPGVREWAAKDSDMMGLRASPVFSKVLDSAHP